MVAFRSRKFIWHQRTLIKKNSKIEYFAFWLSKFIICISDEVKNSFKDSKNKKLIKIYNIFNFQKKIYFNKNDKVIFLLCSKLIKNKNVNIYFQIIDKLNRTKNNFIFWIVGDGDQLVHYKKKFQSARNVKFFGFQINTTKFFRSANILINPSRIEAFGRTIVESLSNGTFVIASNINSFKEIENKKDLITFAENNSNSFINKINLSLKNKNYLNKKNIQKKFEKKLVKKFSKTNILKIENLYNDK